MQIHKYNCYKTQCIVTVHTVGRNEQSRRQDDRPGGACMILGGAPGGGDYFI